MIEKTEGIALRVFPFSRTSHVVAWFTPLHGKTSTVVKGAQRTRSAFLGQYDLFYTCEILFYSRQRNSLHVLKECCPLVSRDEFRRSWQACAAASYLCDLIWRICPAAAPHAELYRLLSACLDTLETHPPSAALILWSELQILRELGMAPQLESCPQCGSDMWTHRGHAAFSSKHGGLLCPDCSAQDGQAAVRLPPDALAILRAWQQATSPQQALRTVCTPRQYQAMKTGLGDFLRYHLELLPASRAIALDLLLPLVDREQRK